jgi:hypothetical protein
VPFSGGEDANDLAHAEVRSMRLLPIETSSPEHTEYRTIVDPFFQRADGYESLTVKFTNLV